MTRIYTRKQQWRRVNLCNIRDIEGDVNIIENIPVKLNEKKAVSFNNDVRVILIPEIKEYVSSRLMYNLWYNNKDYYNFVKDRNEELNNKYNNL